MIQDIREEDWKEELYQVFHNMPSTVDARTEKFHEIVKKIDSHLNTTLKEIEGNEKKVLECLSKIKDTDQKRCNEASKENKVYDVLVTSWAQTAEALIHQKIIK